MWNKIIKCKHAISKCKWQQLSTQQCDSTDCSKTHKKVKTEKTQRSEGQQHNVISFKCLDSLLNKSTVFKNFLNILQQSLECFNWQVSGYLRKVIGCYRGTLQSGTRTDGNADRVLPDEALPVHGGRGDRVDADSATGQHSGSAAAVPAGPAAEHVAPGRGLSTSAL